MSSQSNTAPVDRFLRIGEVVEIVGLSRSEVYRLIGRDAFPAPVKLNDRRNAPAFWVAREVQQWMHTRVTEWRAERESAANDDIST
jgi:prophage regulatory protein